MPKVTTTYYRYDDAGRIAETVVVENDVPVDLSQVPREQWPDNVVPFPTGEAEDE